MELATVIGLIALMLLVVAAVSWNNKKKVTAKTTGIMGIILAVVVAVATFGGFAPLSTGGDGVNTGDNGDTGDTNVDERLTKFYDTIKVKTETYASNSYTTVSGTVEVYKADVDPTASNVNPMETGSISSGTGNITGDLKTTEKYKTVFDGGSTYYDMWYKGAEASYFPYVETDSSTISSVPITFENIVTVASFGDPIDESATDGSINGQTTTSNDTEASNELNIEGSVADDNDLVYDKSVGDGQFYLEMDISVDGANEGVKNPVLCFSDSRDAGLEGNEFSSVTAQLQTGTDLGVPSDLTNTVNDKGCVPLGSEEIVDGGTSATYKLTFNADEDNLASAGDTLFINIDDLGDYKGKDIMNDPKASASNTITIDVQD